jgi:hypothetical protein
VAGLKASLHLAYVLAVSLVIVGPFLPERVFGSTASTIAGWLRQVSVVQSWRMYAPDPQRAQIYMDLTAVDDDGTERPLVETDIERAGWGTQWAWDKTRMDIWRHYANFRPKQNNAHRTWYLRAVCVREARRGTIPKKIVMHHVRRRFSPPDAVVQGAPALSAPVRTFVTVAYCRSQNVKAMIEADRARRGEETPTE